MHSNPRLRAATVALGAGFVLASASPTIAGNCSSGAVTGAASTGADKNIVETAVAAGGFETLVTAVQAANLAEALQGEGPFTVFAPTDEAFAALPEGMLESLLRPESKEQLVEILTYHVVSGRVPAAVAVELDDATTLSGEKLDLDFDGSTLSIDDAEVVQADVEASNGVIHVIDRVLMPDQDMRQTSAAAELIRRAIDRGAPMYNHGNAAACAAVYRTCADALMVMNVLDERQERRMAQAMQEAASTHDMSRRAWMMRYALDEAYASLGEMRTSMN